MLVGNHGKLITELEKKGINCIVLEDNTDIDYSVRNHADMAAFLLHGEKILLDKRQQKAKAELEKLGFKVILTKENICGKYPDDVKLNAVMLGNTLICNEKYISREIINDAERIISVRQGYTKCSVCPVNEKAFITDDKGIYEKCRSLFDVLLIDKGDILLENKEYGFIGGASAKLGEKIIFFGSLSYHRDGERIKAFLEKHGVKYECLFDGQLIDMGGFVKVF